MQAAHAAGRYAPEERSFSVRRKPRSGAPLCPTCDAALEPLAIMGVRLRVRHQSVQRARGTRGFPVLPELSLTTAFPITLFRRFPAGSVRLAPDSYHSAQEPHATEAIRPFAW